MTTISCVTLSGSIKQVPAEQVKFRPAAYAILLRERRILLLKMKATGKYHLPGGGVEINERLEEALQREMQEETGIVVRVERLAHFEEFFFYYDPSGHAYHGLHFYYLCTPVAGALIADDQVMDEAAEQPRWVAIDDLNPEDFQVAGETVLALCRRELTASER